MPKLCLKFGSALSVDFFTFEPNFCVCVCVHACVRVNGVGGYLASRSTLECGYYSSYSDVPMDFVLGYCWFFAVTKGNSEIPNYSS